MTDEERRLSFVGFIGLYLALVMGGIAVGIVGEAGFRLDGLRVGAGYCGLLFLLGAAGRPRILFEAIRSAGAFSFIPSESVVRVVCGLLGVIGVGVALAIW
jgi:hypothetical protein